MADRPRVTRHAPNFECSALMPDKTFKTLRLDDYKGKYLVLFFYPLDFTFVCPTEILSFSDAADEFKKINCEVVGASVDSQYTHHAWVETPRNKGGLGKINIPLLADMDRKVSRAYDCMIDAEGHTCRATFIIDDKGIVRHISHNDPPVGRNIDEYLRLVQGYQHSDKHGEVCPAKWKPGDLTINADPKGKLQYFQEVNK